MNTAAQNQRDRDDRPGHFLHRLDRRFARAHALVDLVLHRLDHHDRVVDDDADRQHQAEHAGHVDREAEQRKQRECADDRDRHRQQRDQRRAPVLQEHEDHEDDQRHRFEQRVDHVGDRGPHEPGRVVSRPCSRCPAGNAVFASSRNARTRSPVSTALAPGVRYTMMTAAGFPLSAAEGLVVLRAELHPADVAHAQQRAIRLRPQDDVGELLRLEQPAGGVHRILEVRAGRRRAADRWRPPGSAGSAPGSRG